MFLHIIAGARINLEAKLYNARQTKHQNNPFFNFKTLKIS